MSELCHDDGDRERRLLCRQARWRAGRDDNVDLERNQLGRKTRKPVGFSLCKSGLKGDVLSFQIAQLAQPLPQCLPELDASRGRGASFQESDPPGSRLLSLRRERRSEEAESENDRELDEPHGAPRWAMAGGSLADGMPVTEELAAWCRAGLLITWSACNKQCCGISST